MCLDIKTPGYTSKLPGLQCSYQERITYAMAHPRELDFVVHEANRLFDKSTYPLVEQRLTDAAQRLKMYSGLLLPDEFGLMVIEGMPIARQTAKPQEIGRTILQLPEGNTGSVIRFYPDITRDIFETILDSETKPPKIPYTSFAFAGQFELSLPRPEGGIHEVVLRGLESSDDERKLQLQLRKHAHAPKGVPRALYVHRATGFPEQEPGRAVPRRGIGFRTSKSPGLGASE